MKEAEHLEGFAPEVAWVTQTGDSELGEKLAIRPTSETIMYDSYSKWVQSWRDLPLRLNQWNNVVRWEFKHSTPFLRSREFLWNEGHTVFATKEEAVAEEKVIIGIYKEILEKYMALYGVVGRKSKNETFPGAEWTHSIECFLPTGKAIQGPDFHHDGQIFSKAFNISFLDEKGERQFAWQNTFAITTRMIGVLIMTHSDDKGLVLPPRLTYNKCVIVPLLFKGKEEAVLEQARKLKERLSSFGAVLDERVGVSPGFKFSEWEIKGMPLRLELGPRDLEQGQIVVVKRHSGEKILVPLSDAEKEVERILNKIQDEMFEKSKAYTLSNRVVCESVGDFEKALAEKKWPVVRWCGDPQCEESLKDLYGVKSNNIPLEQDKVAKGKCVFCSRDASCYAHLCKSL